MFKRYRLFRVLGFPIYVELSFLLLGAFYLIMGGFSPQDLLASLIFIVAVILSILWHELGHAFMARRLGATGISIVLHGAGGLTSHSPLGGPRRSLRVSAAGPGFGLALGLAALGLGWLAGPTGLGVLGVFWQDLIFINIFWSLFNLLPMLPLDGGNILRDLLLLRMSAWRAMELSLAVSFGLAVVIGLLAMSQRWLLITLVCLFSGQMTWMQMGGWGPLQRFWRNLRR